MPDETEIPEREPGAPAFLVQTQNTPEDGPRVAIHWWARFTSLYLQLGADGARALADDLLEAADEIDPPTEPEPPVSKPRKTPRQGLTSEQMLDRMNNDPAMALLLIGQRIQLALEDDDTADALLELAKKARPLVYKAVRTLGLDLADEPTCALVAGFLMNFREDDDDRRARGIHTPPDPGESEPTPTERTRA